MTSKVPLFSLIILFALVFLPSANALNVTVGEITIKGTDTYYDATLSGVTIKTNKVPITDLFLFNQDATFQKDFSCVSIPTDAIPIKNLFISNADAILTKSLGSATNQPPIVSFTYSPSNPAVNQSVTFNASTSYAPAGTIVKYVWDFGDGSNAAGITVTHPYSKIGDYNVILTVTDDKWATNTASKVINAFAISDQPKYLIFKGTTELDFNDTFNFPSTYGTDTVSVFYNPLTNTLTLSLYAWGDVLLPSYGIIDSGSIIVAIPEELDINYEQNSILLMEHATGDPEVATNIISMSFDESNSLFEQAVNMGLIARNYANCVISIISSPVSFFLTLFGYDLTPSSESISIPSSSKFNDVNHYDTIGVSFVDLDNLDVGLSPDVHEVFVLIPLEGNYEGKSIAILGAYKTNDDRKIRQFYKENIVLG